MLNKKDLITETRLHTKDTGSVCVQISSLSYDINTLTEHLKKFKKDHHSKKGLIDKVNRRKRLLKYIKNTDNKKYEYIIKYLNIRK